MDLSHATDEELKSELEGMQKALEAVMSGAGPGRPRDGRDERMQVDLQQQMEAIKSELDNRKVSRS